MVKKITFILFFLLLSLFSDKIWASSRTYLKLDRVKVSNSLSGTLCHQPSSADSGIEGNVSISFPSDFIINTSVSHWTTNSNTLPSGASSWPHIGSQALTVSGNSVRFASGDLTSASALYCFNFESTESKTSVTTGIKNATVATFSSGGTHIESKDVTLAIIKNDQMSITGTIKEKSMDFPLEIVKKTTGETFSQYATLEYTITYGSNLSYKTPLTLEASWNAGEIEGAPGSTVDVLEYINGSAGVAYNATVPTIDLVNKKIIWNIPSFPAKKKDQTVSFKLRTNALYTGKRKVESRVVARILTDTTSAEKIVTTVYLYNPQFEATPQEPIVVYLRSVISDRALIFIQTLDETNVRVQYGVDPSDRTQRVSTLQYAKEQTVVLSNLIPETTYYFTVTAVKKDGTKTISDIFIFKTAQISVAPDINQDSLVFISSNIILSYPDDQKTGAPTFTLPKGTSYNFRFKLNRFETAKEVQGTVRHKSVLGINNEEIIDPTSTDATLFERQLGLFEGRLKSPETSGTYELFLKVSDYSGNIVENKIAEVYVTEKFTIKNKKTGNSIEGVQILLSYYNPRTRIFDVIPEKVIPIKNPSYTDIKGQISYPLPSGKYKAQIVAIGFTAQDIEFTIGGKPGEEYPTVYLSPKPFNLFTFGLYYGTIIRDLSHSFQAYIQKLANSVRFFELNALLAITFLVFLSLLSFSSRLRIPLHSLIEYFLHRTKISTIHKKIGQRIKGRIFDEETGEILAMADVFLVDAEKNKVVGHTKTSQKGDFSFLKYPERAYELEVMKNGYEPIVFHESDIQAVELGGYLLSIHKRELGRTVREKVKVYTEKILSLLFEALLILSIISEISLGYSLGWQKAAPFLSISLVNLGLWIVHLSHLRNERNIF